MNFIFYSDPAHGWLKVKKSLLIDLGISKKISSCSYMKNEYAYLEEDCDLTLLLNTLDSSNISYKIIEHSPANNESIIRGYQFFEGTIA